MCGIAGRLSTKPLAPQRLETVRVAMRRRGPDAEGKWTGEIAGRPAVLLHSRLAIVDLDRRSDQPFEFDGGVLLFNGEIYNWRELRAELERGGAAFRTQSDTEVVAAAWRAWGEAAFARFEGMWALAIHDSRADVLVLGRDAFGEKPLFLLDRDGELVFGSETNFLAGLAARPLVPDRRQVLRYLVNGYRALHKGTATWHEGVREVPAGSFVRVTRAGVSAPVEYWRPKVGSRAMSLADAEAGVRARVMRARTAASCRRADRILPERWRRLDRAGVPRGEAFRLSGSRFLDRRFRSALRRKRVDRRDGGASRVPP
jgi:asparagine synthase (glutamine-hydrolysing)